MKVCYVATDVRLPSYLGSSTHVYEVATNLSSLGVQVHVICRKEKGQPFAERFDSFLVHRVPRYMKSVTFFEESLLMKTKHLRSTMSTFYNFYLNYLHSFLSFLCVLYVTRKYGIDLILERSSSRGAGVLAGVATHRPIVLEVNDPIFSRLAMPLAKRIITTDETLISKNISKSKVTVVTWAANTELFNPSTSGREIRQKYGLMEKQVVVYVGSFAEWHGLKDLILASKRVIQRNPRVYFLIIGGDPGLRNLKRITALTKELNVYKNFIFTGPIPYHDVPKYINAGDVTVAPYNPAGRPVSFLKKHGFFGSPLKIFEYMACGKPVIATNVGKIPSIIQNGENGLLVSPRNPEELSKSIVRLLDDGELARRLGETARKAAVKKFSWKKHARFLVEMFNEVLSETMTD